MKEVHFHKRSYLFISQILRKSRWHADSICFSWYLVSKRLWDSSLPSSCAHLLRWMVRCLRNFTALPTLVSRPTARYIATKAQPLCLHILLLPPPSPLSLTFLIFCVFLFMEVAYLFLEDKLCMWLSSSPATLQLLSVWGLTCTVCVFLCPSKWCGCQCLVDLTHAQMLWHALVCRGCVNIARQSALNAELDKNPLLHWGVKAALATRWADAQLTELHPCLNFWF